MRERKALQQLGADGCTRAQGACVCIDLRGHAQSFWPENWQHRAEQCLRLFPASAGVGGAQEEEAHVASRLRGLPLKLSVGHPSRACVRGSPSFAPAHVALGLPGRVHGLSGLSEGHWLAGCVHALELAFKAKGLFSCEPLLSQEWRAVQHWCS